MSTDSRVILNTPTIYQPCKYWGKRDGCWYGMGCRYIHYQTKSKSTTLAIKILQKKHIAHDSSTQINPSSSSSSSLLKRENIFEIPLFMHIDPSVEIDNDTKEIPQAEEVNFFSFDQLPFLKQLPFLNINDFLSFMYKTLGPGYDIKKTPSPKNFSFHRLPFFQKIAPLHPTETFPEIFEVYLNKLSQQAFLFQKL